MTYLLDTSVWVRAANAQATLPPRALNILETPGEVFGLSAISLWEVAKKVQRGKLRLPKRIENWFEDALAANIQIIPLSTRVVIDATSLPRFPLRDPADELIVATARTFSLTLLTTDTKLKHYTYAQIQYFAPRIPAS